MTTRRSRLMVSLVLAGSLAGACGGAAAPSTSVTDPSSPIVPAVVTPAPSPSAFASEVNGGGLVGEWVRVNSCEAYAGALEAAGFGPRIRRWLVDFGGYWTSQDQIPTEDPCAGAHEAEHSHFFTADGRFGSHDEDGAQVDDGDYRIVDATTLAFPSHEREFGFAPIVVHYAIGDDETIEFTVDVPDPCDEACEVATVWAISAFYPGPFERK